MTPLGYLGNDVWCLFKSTLTGHRRSYYGVNRRYHRYRHHRSTTARFIGIVVLASVTKPTAGSFTAKALLSLKRRISSSYHKHNRRCVSSGLEAPAEVVWFQGYRMKQRLPYSLSTLLAPSSPHNIFLKPFLFTHFMIDLFVLYRLVAVSSCEGWARIGRGSETPASSQEPLKHTLKLSVSPPAPLPFSPNRYSRLPFLFAHVHRAFCDHQDEGVSHCLKCGAHQPVDRKAQQEPTGARLTHKRILAFWPEESAPVINDLFKRSNGVRGGPTEAAQSKPSPAARLLCSPKCWTCINQSFIDFNILTFAHIYRENRILFRFFLDVNLLWASWKARRLQMKRKLHLQPTKVDPFD